VTDLLDYMKIVVVLENRRVQWRF